MPEDVIPDIKKNLGILFDGEENVNHPKKTIKQASDANEVEITSDDRDVNDLLRFIEGEHISYKNKKRVKKNKEESE